MFIQPRSHIVQRASLRETDTLLPFSCSPSESHQVFYLNLHVEFEIPILDIQVSWHILVRRSEGVRVTSTDLSESPNAPDNGQSPLDIVT